jgi:hypothetical protein
VLTGMAANSSRRSGRGSNRGSHPGSSHDMASALIFCEAGTQVELIGFPNLLLIVPEGVREGRSARPFVTRSGACTSVARSHPRTPLYVTTEDRLVELGVLGVFARRWKPVHRRRSASRSWTCQPSPATSTGPHDASAATSRMLMPAVGVAFPPSQPPPGVRALPPRHAP